MIRKRVRRCSCNREFAHVVGYGASELCGICLAKARARAKTRVQTRAAEKPKP